MTGSKKAIITARMLGQVQDWERLHDRRSIFLGCYQLMTGNMLAAIEAAEFSDAPWVDRLLHHFASYYFNALEAYEKRSPATPAVWQQTFDACRQEETNVFQNLLLGMNAHINYDLVFTLVDILGEEWNALEEEQRSQRYTDHFHVNSIIYRTIDAVQDAIIEPRDSLLEIADRLLGPVDEWALSMLVTHWRDEVWENALRLLDTPEPGLRLQKVRQIENEAIQRGRIILKYA
jgi:hypothetical protein